MKTRNYFKLLLGATLFALAQPAFAVTSGVWGYVYRAYGGNCEPTDNNLQGVIPGAGTVLGYTGRVCLVPGKTYQIVCGPGAADPDGEWPAQLVVKAPAGYDVFINGNKTNSVLNHLPDPVAMTVRIAGPGESYSGRAGTCTSFKPGQLFWQMSVGQNVEGEATFPLTLCGGAIERSDDWTDLWTPRVLSDRWIFTGPGSGGGPQCVYGIDVISPTCYEIKVYEQGQDLHYSGWRGPITCNSLPFVVYRVEKGSSNTSLRITRETRQKQSKDDATAPIILTERTSIERIGSWPNCTWVVNDWNEVGKPQQVVKTLVSSESNGRVTETLDIKDGGGSIASTETRVYQKFWWGYSPVSITTGTGVGARSSEIEYYTDTPYPAAERRKSHSDGTWQEYTWRDGAVAKVATLTQPATGGKNQRFEYDYFTFDTGQPNPYGGIDVELRNDFSDVREYFDGVMCARKRLDSAYGGGGWFEHYRKYSVFLNSGAAITEEILRDKAMPDIVNGKMSSAGDALWHTTSYSLASNVYRAVTVRGSRRSQDGMKLFERGADIDEYIPYPYASYTPGGTGDHRESMYPFDLYLVAGKSTKQIEIWGWVSGRVRCSRTEEYVWDGSAWQLTGWENLGFDTSCNLTSRMNHKGELWQAVYIGDRKQWEKSSDGTEVSYTYDPAGRVRTATKAAYGSLSALTTTFTYNALGQVLTEVVSSAGTTETLTTTRTYDDAGRLRSEQLPGQSATRYDYSPATRQTTTTLPSGATIIETRNLDGSLASKTGTGVVPTYYTYGVETDGRRWTRTDIGSSSSARWTKVWTDWLDNVVREEKPGAPSFDNTVATHTYEGSTGRLVKSEVTGLAPTLYQYGVMGQLFRTGQDIDGNGSLTLASADRITESDTYFEKIDSQWWLTKTAITYPFLNSATAKTLTVARERVTGFSGTLRGETRSTDAEGNQTTQTINVDDSSHTTTITTTAPGLALSRVDTAVEGLPVSSQGFDGLTSAITYDTLRRISTTKGPRHSGSGTIKYWPNTALVQELLDAAGKRLSYTSYDTAGRPSVVYDAYNKTTRYAYTARGEIEHQWGSATYPVSFTYDTYGQRTKQRTYQDRSGAINWDSDTWPGGSATASETEWEFDAATGLLLKKYDPSRRYVEQTYNLRGQTYQRFWNRHLNPSDESSARVTATFEYYGSTGEPKSVSYNDGTPTVSYTYTRSGQIDSVSDATGTRDFVYDSYRPWRLASEALDSSFYDNRVITLGYDSSTSTNTGSTAYAGHTIGSVMGRPRSYTVGVSGSATPDQSVFWAVSNTGRIAGATSASHSGAGDHTFIYGYEANSALVKSLSVSGNAFFVSRDFEPNRDVVTSIATKWSATTVSHFGYLYDDRAQRKSVVQSGSAFADYGSAIHLRFAHNDRRELTQAATYLGDNPDAATSTALAGRWHEFGYDAIGNRKWSNTSGVTGLRDEYEVNERNQYTTRENNTLSVGGTADPSAIVVAGSNATAAAGRAGAHWGDNLLVDNAGKPFYGGISFYSARSSTGTGSNNLVSAITKTAFLPPAAQSFTYDLDGNLTSDGVWEYLWDAENRLVRATTTAGAALAGVPNREIDFVYDYLGRRVEKRVYNHANSTQIFGRRYLYNGWNVVAEIQNNNVIRSYTWGLDLTGSQTAAGGVGALVQIYDHRNDRAYFPGYDGNGNLAVLVDASSGSLAAAYEYSPYGEMLRCEGAYAQENVYRFSTKEVESELGLYYYGHRYYDPHNGRFINRDPSEESGGLNLYGFVANNPICAWDYLGLQSEDNSLKLAKEAEKALKEAEYQNVHADGGTITATKDGVTYSFDYNSGKVSLSDSDGHRGEANIKDGFLLDAQSDGRTAVYHYTPPIALSFGPLIAAKTESLEELAAVGALPNTKSPQGLHVIIVNSFYKKKKDEADGKDLLGMALATAAASPETTRIIRANSLSVALLELNFLKSNNMLPGGISQLSIVDHCSSLLSFNGGQATTIVQKIGDDKLTSENLKEFSPYLAPDAIVVYQGCLTGLHQAYLDESSAALGGLPVYGYKNFNYPQYYEDTGKYVPLEVPKNNPHFGRSK